MSNEKSLPEYIGDLAAAAALYAGFFYFIPFSIADLAQAEFSNGTKKYPFMTEPVQYLDAVIEIKWSHFMILCCTFIFSLALMTFMLLLGALIINKSDSFLFFKNSYVLASSMIKVSYFLFLVINFSALIMLPITILRLIAAPGSAFPIAGIMVCIFLVILILIGLIYKKNS